MRVLRPVPRALVAIALAALAGDSLPASPLQEAAPARPAAPAPPEPEDDWVPLTPMERDLAIRYGDHSVGVAGEELLTLQEMRAYQRTPDFEDPASELPVDTDPMLLAEERMIAAMVQRSITELKIQGGKTQGYDPELIQRALEGSFQSQIEGRGGPVPFADWIQGMGFDADSFRTFLRNRLFAQLWTDAVTGRSSGPTGRVFVDAYVRPAAMYRRYQTLLTSPSPQGAEEIGRQPAMVSLRRLVIGSQQSGSPKRALELSQALRSNILDDTITFDDALGEFALERMKGEASRLEVAAEQAAPILQQLHPEWSAADFLAAAAPGDLSPVLLVSSGGPVEFVLIYRFEGRSEATEALPFKGLQLQETLRRAISEDLETVRVDRGISELARTARITPEPIRIRLIRGPLGR